MFYLICRYFYFFSFSNYQCGFCLKIKKFFNGVTCFYLRSCFKILAEGNKGDDYNGDIIVGIACINELLEWFMKSHYDKAIEIGHASTDTDQSIHICFAIAEKAIHTDQIRFAHDKQHIRSHERQEGMKKFREICSWCRNEFVVGKNVQAHDENTNNGQWNSRHHHVFLGGKLY